MKQTVAVISHCKLLKQQHPQLSAHFIVTRSRFAQDSASSKPARVIMQTVHQWSRGRRKCSALDNPPLLHNLQAEKSSDGSGLTAVFQAMCAGDPAQVLSDTGADDNVIDHAFAQRVGIH